MTTNDIENDAEEIADKDASDLDLHKETVHGAVNDLDDEDLDDAAGAGPRDTRTCL